MIKTKLDIVLITFNRKPFLKETLDVLLSESSPINDFDITILDNASTDGTGELIKEYLLKYSNLKYIKNTKNIGGCANIAKALVEVPQKEYVWVLCDNDTYDWDAWKDVECGIEQNFDVVMTRKCSQNWADIFYKSAFVPACIYKTKNITEAVAENIYGSIKTLFPHLALTAKNINDNKSFYFVSKNIVNIGKNPNQNASFTRGHNKKDLPDSRKNIFWSVGYFSSLEYIKDKKIRTEIIDGTRHYHNSLFDLFRAGIIINKLYYNNYYPNLLKIFSTLNLRQKLMYILAFISVKFSLKDYSFYDLRTKDDWKNYFEKVKEQKYIDSLSKSLKGKKVLLYGGGLVAESLLLNYDLSNLNIIGIADKKFEYSKTNKFCGIKAVNPELILQEKPDVILYSLMKEKNASNYLKEMGITIPTTSIIKKKFKYLIKS